MDSLKSFFLVLAVQGSFLNGLLNGLHLPQNEESWGQLLGGLILLLAGQWLSGHVTQRKVKKLVYQYLPKPTTPTPVTS